jgi:hypothetical protein
METLQEDYWWMNPSNFPCMLIADTSEGQILVWVHYAAHGNAYDCRDNMYRLTPHTNWRRATKEEILANIKGI